jgi:D-3-phosphoglycerate dehydrogenase / 2-oxoglutarate reductase
MTDTVVEAFILDLLEWLAARDRSYDEVMEAWRTSCPKLPVWEDANARGLIAMANPDGRCVVRVTPSGLALLQHRRRLSAQR